jgi:hypothetical protein
VPCAPPAALRREGLPLHLLVEDVLGLGLCQSVAIGCGIRKPVVPRRHADVGENTLYRGGRGDEGDDAHVEAVAGTDR